MARTLTVHLSDAQADRLDRYAKAHGAPPDETARRLVDEALRAADYPDIEFRNSAAGRRACVRGSSLAVWEVVMLARDRGDDAEATAAHLGWPIQRVHAALDYAREYSDEVLGALSDNESFEAESLRELLPNVRVNDIDMSDLA